MRLGFRWRRVRLSLLSAILVALVGYTGCDFLAGRRLAAEVAKFEARYGTLSSEMIKPPEVPAAENRARLVNAAAALMNTVTTQHRTALSRFVADQAKKTVPQELRVYVDSNAQAIQMARQFVTRPRSSFGVDYRSAGDRPPLIDIRTLSRVLYVATLVAIEDRKPDEAAALIVAGQSMSSAGRNEPDLVAQLIRVAIADSSVDATQRLLQNSEPTQVGLEQIARALAENREPAPMTAGLMGEVRNVHYVFSNLEAGRTRDVADNFLPWPIVRAAPRLSRPLVRLAQASYLAQFGRLIDEQTGPRPRPVWSEQDKPPAWAFVDRMSYTFTAGIRRAMDTGDEFTRTQAAAELAVALRRHKLDRASYPDDLGALVPAYLPSVPIDPLTGKPPRYSREGDGFTLTMEPSRIYAPGKRPTDVWKLTK